MRKLLAVLGISLLLFSCNQNGTSTKKPYRIDKLLSELDSVYIIKKIDEMSGETSVRVNRFLWLGDDDGVSRFAVSPHIEVDSVFSLVSVIMMDMGNCNENDEIIILFDNGERIIKKSFNKFNCDGIALFDMNKEEIQLLRTQPISKIRITNGYTHDSYTSYVKENDKRYFIKLFYILDNKL